ncbi:MAG: N,N-dimethylformamidase [Alphaproteobacteria bacterium]|nr:N,N-dimethylformamidase [Alphaproteobacteria bacterium]
MTTIKEKKIVGYTNRISVQPGETVRFMVSCYGVSHYRADIVRLISGDRHPEGAGFKETVMEPVAAGEFAGRQQAIHAGSHGVIGRDAPFAALSSFTLQAMIWPTTPARGRQALLGKWSEPDQSGYALVIDNDATLALMLGDGEDNVEIVSSGQPLHEREWYLVGASFDAETGEVCIHQVPLVENPLANSVAEVCKTRTSRRPGRSHAPFMIAATYGGEAGGRAVGTHHYNGKIDSPRIANRVLDRDSMTALLQRPIPADLRPAVIAAWDFARAIPTTRIEDASANRIDGMLVNLPMRAMTGYNWTGKEMNWQHAPEQYGAIHFHEDDLYDAGWEADFEYTIPADMRSGVYAARLTSGEDEDHIPFFVRPPRGSRNADLALLIPTASYWAYANEHMVVESSGSEIFNGHLTSLSPEDLFLNAHPEFGHSMYDVFFDGSAVCHSSRLRPILNMRPGITISWVGPGGNMPWQFNADLHIVDWLEAMGHDYDVITDDDLDDEGLQLIGQYSAVMTGTHPEYVSTRMWDAFDTYLRQGGRLMYMGGNGFYSRVAYHGTLPGVVELRRTEVEFREKSAAPGEYYHSFNGEYGGIWRRIGRPPGTLVGVGMAVEGFDICGYYSRKPGSYESRAEFIFSGIDDEIIGDFGVVGGGAAGIELDRCDGDLGSPPHTLVLASSEGLSNQYLPTVEDCLMISPGLGAMDNSQARGDMVFFETPNGGGVFSTSSMSWSGSLCHNGYDNNVSKVTDNVLRRFLDPAPL